MRVGALPQHPTGLMGKSFNWSPEGIADEHLNDCKVVEDDRVRLVSPMQWVGTLFIGGTDLEAFTTFGGLGTMCGTYKDCGRNMDYKTMRYPGHVQLMNFYLHELLTRERREQAGDATRLRGDLSAREMPSRQRERRATRKERRPTARLKPSEENLTLVVRRHGRAYQGIRTQRRMKKLSDLCVTSTPSRTPQRSGCT